MNKLIKKITENLICLTLHFQMQQWTCGVKAHLLAAA